MPATASADQTEIEKFDALAHEFWDARGSFRPLHALNPVRLDYISARTALAGRRVLDVGCGGGLLTEALARRGAQVVGVDLAPAMIEIARLHASESALAIDYRLSSAEALVATDAGGFDVITCMELLEHVPDPAGTLAALARLLRPTGQLFVSTINRTLRSFLFAIVGAEYLLNLIPRGTHEYARLIRPAELARMARAQQLALRDISGVQFNPLSGAAAVRGDPGINYLAHFERES
ncbi:MAG: bifunctional 2-polyprenyl-6-hydroxyphenol methylase/3-demethylubiquinol 3-O-methyltransferase UbiG [Steroidobacterales bacterium]|jgi:2-polyprenyl-6-hydroxyphenyl methylase/3-demethylubiquinone-9 3-methyltransferase